METVAQSVLILIIGMEGDVSLTVQMAIMKILLIKYVSSVPMAVLLVTLMLSVLLVKLIIILTLLLSCALTAVNSATIVQDLDRINVHLARNLSTSKIINVAISHVPLASIQTLFWAVSNVPINGVTLSLVTRQSHSSVSQLSNYPMVNVNHVHSLMDIFYLPKVITHVSKCVEMVNSSTISVMITITIMEMDVHLIVSLRKGGHVLEIQLRYQFVC